MEGKFTLVRKVRQSKILIGFMSVLMFSETISLNNTPSSTELPSVELEMADVKATQTRGKKVSQSAKKCLRATNYYLPDLDTDARFKGCKRTAKVKMGKETVKVCPQFMAAVKMQGSGHLSYKGKKYRLHYSGNMELVSKTKCSTAVGAANQCLVPYVHVAADPKYFHMGDIIEVPELRYARLPRLDGQGEFIHPGYFIVGDTGGDIKGNNRFDFFVGKLEVLTRDNPFGPWGKKMTDENNCIMSFKRISKAAHPQKVKRMTKSVIASAAGSKDVLVASRTK